jgi:bacteriocin propeptide, TIGR03798 family
MSVENVKLFYDKLAADDGLKEKVAALAAKMSDKASIDELIKIAQDAGFNFSEKDVTEARKNLTKSEPDLYVNTFSVLKGISCEGTPYTCEQCVGAVPLNYHL